MIEVKGIRSDQSRLDPSDPLELDEPEQNNKKMMALWFGGLVSIGLYIRSFLWSEPQAAIVQEEDVPKGSDDGKESGTPAANKSMLAAAEQEQPEGQGSDDDATEVLSDGGSFRFPVVLGQFEYIFFGQDYTSTFGSELRQVSANAALAPFQWLNELNRPSQNATFGTPAFRSEGQSKSKAAEIIEIEDPFEDDETDPVDDRNRAPRNTGPVYLADVGSGAAVVFALSYFLANTTDPDGNPLSISMGHSTSGAFDQKGDGWRYLADVDFLGNVEVAYTISDGFIEIAQKAFLNVVENLFEGSDGDELIVGTRGRDRIDGLAGDDNLAGLGGRDTIDGGAGDDNIAGGDGDDILFGGFGDDLIAGGRGNDWISGGAGNDRLYGEAGDDEIYGGTGNDEIHGGEGNDRLYGEEGIDLVFGGAGNDQIFGGAGDDLLYGEDGNDEMRGGEDNDDLSGGDGNDQLFGNAGDDTISGGAGEDLISGDDGQDVLYGNDGNDVIFAGSGDDKIDGGADDDLLFGGEGNDHLDGGDGHDVISGEAGSDSLIGGIGNDVLSGGDGQDIVLGGIGDDLVIADDDGVSDHYDGGEGHDQLDYSAATQAVSFNLIDGTASGQSTGEDSFDNFEHFVGTTGNDRYYAGAGSAELTGNGGSDIYSFVQGDTVDAIRSIYQITDFDSDDEIRIGSGASQRQIRDAQRSLEDRIEEGFGDYADGIGADEPRLSYQHDWTDTYKRTVIEVDFDRDNVVDLQLILEGEHVLIFDHA